MTWVYWLSNIRLGYLFKCFGLWHLIHADAAFSLQSILWLSTSLMYHIAYTVGTIYLDVSYGYLWRRQWHPTPVLLPGKSHGRRSLVGCGPWGCWESDTTERLHFHFSLSCPGEGNGNPLQCPCLENPRDGGAWWAAVYGVAQSRTRLKRLSSSSSNNSIYLPECLIV